MTVNMREQKGREISARYQLRREGKFWLVPSQSARGKYKVSLESQTCTCPDYETRRSKCKHIYAVEFTIEREQEDKGESTSPFNPEEAKVKKPTYKQEWSAYHKAQTEEKEQFQILLATLCHGLGEPGQIMGRPRIPLSDVIFSAAFKVYSTVSCRRFMSDLREAHKRGHLSQLPHYNSIFNYLELEMLTPHLKLLIEESSLPLTSVEQSFAVDSSGFSTSRYVQWVHAKYSEPHLIDKKDWLKVHLMCGVRTNVVTAVEVSDRHAGDSPRFKPLVETTAQNFVINEVSADKAYSASDNLKVVLDNNGMPYIPFRSNATATNRRSNAVWRRMFHFYSYNQEWFLKHYHKRSNVESTFSMIKAKFGDHLRSKTEKAQINEALCKVLCHNLCCLIQSMFELGVKPNFWDQTI